MQITPFSFHVFLPHPESNSLSLSLSWVWELWLQLGRKRGSFGMEKGPGKAEAEDGKGKAYELGLGIFNLEEWKPEAIQEGFGRTRGVCQPSSGSGHKCVNSLWSMKTIPMVPEDRTPGKYSEAAPWVRPLAYIARKGLHRNGFAGSRCRLSQQ